MVKPPSEETWQIGHYVIDNAQSASESHDILQQVLQSNSLISGAPFDFHGKSVTVWDRGHYLREHPDIDLGPMPEQED